MPMLARTVRITMMVMVVMVVRKTTDDGKKSASLYHFGHPSSSAASPRNHVIMDLIGIAAWSRV